MSKKNNSSFLEGYEDFKKRREEEKNTSFIEGYKQYKKRREEENARVIESWRGSPKTITQPNPTSDLRLENQIKRTNSQTLPRIAQQVAEDYLQNRMGYDTIAKYDDNTRYSDVSSDIEHLKQLRGGAARRDRDTGVYDRALEMLKGYSQRYRLDDTDTSPEAVKDRENLYNDNKREISRLNSQLEAEKGGSLNQALRQWLDSYDDNGIITDEDNQYIIDNIKNDTGYDLSETLGGLDSAERQAKAEELRALVGQDDSQKRKRIQDRIKALTAQNTAYERTQKKSDDYADLYRDKAKEEEKDPYGLLSGSLHTRNMVPKDYYESVEGKDNPLFTESGDLSQPMIKRFEDSPAASSAYKNIDAHTEMLTADEKEIYSYLLRNKSELEAKAYIDELKDTLQKRYNDSAAEYIDDANGVEKAILLASSVPMNVYGSVTGFAEDAINMATGGEIHPYSEAHAMYNIGQQTRSAVANDIDEATGGANVAGFSLGDAFQAAMSIPDFMLGSLTPEFYLASMSMGAAQSRAKELWEEGASYDQIVSESVLTGAAEAIFEEVSLDKIVKMANGGSLKDYITTALKGMAIEGSEEVNTEIANILTDVIVRGSQSDWGKAIQKYIDEGYSEKEAKGLALGDMVKQVGYAGVGGMIGGAGGSAGVAFNKGAGLIQQKQERNQYARQAGQAVTGAGNTQALLDRATQIDDPAVKAQAQKTQQALDKANQNSTKSTNNRLSRETGKLYAAMQDSTAQGIQNAEANEIKAAIKSAYAAETGETDSSVISKAADAIYKSEYTDERLTRSERNLAETAAAQSALESVKNNPDLIESATQKAQERGFRDYVETAKLTQKQEQETKTDDDVDIDEFNYHEDDGKVYTSDGKKQVDIASVASIGDNDITFNLNDGQTESAKSLDMPTNQAVLAQSILDVQKKIGVPLTADIANTLYQGYEQSDSPSVSAYMQDAQTVLFNGYANNTAPDSSINLPQELRDQLYRMGRQLAASHTQAQQQNVNARVKGNKSRKGTVTFQDGINRNKLDPRRRAGVDAVEHLAQSLGFDVVFYRSTKDGKGRFSSEYVRKNKFVADGQQAPSGFWRGGKMYLDINAGMNGEGLILFTASHELVHMIREGSPEGFKGLSDFLVKNYAEQGVDINDLVRKEMARSTNLTRDQALEEVIAESCEPFLRDTTLNGKAQELYKQNPTLWSRIREALKRIVDAVKQWYSVARPQSEEARITMRAGVETLEQAYDLWTKGIIKSAENLRNMERESTDTKYQGRAEAQDTEYLDAVERGDMDTAQRMVDEAAKVAGAYTQYGSYTPELFYHGTRAEGFTEFRYSRNNQTGTDYGKAFYFTTDYEKAAGYAYDISKDSRVNDYKAERDRLTKEFLKSPTTENKERLKKHHETLYEIIDGGNNGGLQKGTEVKSTYLFMKNPLVVDANGEYYYKVYPDYFKAAKQLGSDGIVVHNVVDNPRGKARPITVGIVFESNQIKSAEPVTYDDDGKVIPLSERFNESNKDIRYQSRDDLFSTDDMFDDDSISSTVAREYITHHEDIGEVLRNIADIELPSSKVQSIVNRVIRSELGYLDEEARRTLSIELQLALERVSKTDAQDVSNEMINAVRKAVEGARITDERTQASYQELRNVFKGKKFYLTDEQINQLKEHDMTFDDFRKAMFGKATIIKRENAKRSINGGYADAQQLSLEGLHDLLDNPEEVLGIRRDEWDNKNYDAPYIIKNAFDTLREQQSQLVTDMYSDEAIDDMAIAIAAKITGDIVEAKYNSRKNPYVSKLVKDLQTKRTEAVNKQKERNKQKLAELKTKERERAEKREQDLKKKYQEQRDRNREGRKRTELRGKIRKLTDSLQRRLTAPKGKQYVPRELISQTVDVLNAVNLDSGRSTRLSEKLAALRNEYDKLKEREESYAMYDGVISNMLLGLSDSVGNTPIMNMTLSQLKQVYDVNRSMDYVIRESVKMTDTNFKKETHQIGRDWIAEIKAVPKEHVGLLSGYVQTMLSAERFFNRIAGFKKNSTSSQLFDMLNKGQLAQTQYEMEFTQIFADLIQDKQLKSLYDTKNLVDIGLVDEDGNKVPITRGMMLSLYMHLLNEDNTRHVMGGGLTVPNMKDYYKGDVKKAFGNGMKSVRVGALDYSQYAEGIKSVIERQLTEYEIKWIEAAQEFFDGASRKALNETTMKLYGFRRANVNNYFPIHTDSNYRAATFENITKDMSLENSGFMKERVKASNPILLEDIVDVINDQISKVAKYCGMTLPIRNFQKVYGTTTFGFETSVQRELNKKFSSSSKNTGATKYIDNLLTDLTSGRSTDDGFIARMMGRARGNLAQATLTLNPRVAIAQAASYPTAAAVIGWEPLFKALRKGGKNNTVFSRADREAIAEISPLLWKRTQGYSNVEIGDIKELRKQRHQVEGKLKKAMGWIELFDGMTVGRLFYACQYYVDEQNPELKRGTAEYNAKVADVYNKVIERTQPNYTTLQRPDILRNPNALIKSLSMFMTQRLQNFNILYDAAGTYNRYLKDYKKGLNGVTAEDVKGARKTLVRSVTSQLVAAGTIVGMKLLADVLLHSMNAYRDDDDELTAESVSLKLLDNFADTLFGSILFGSDLYALIKTAVSGERYYGISLSGVDSVVDAITNIVNLRKGITLDSANKAATSVCQLFGIPLNNAEKIGKAIYYWSSDISGGEAFESGVNRTIKQNLHRYETRLNSGEADKAKELLTAMLDDKMSQGKTEKEAKSWLRGRFTATYKQRYIDAMNSKDTEEVKNIREILLSTGLYGSLSDLDKTLKNWLK